jgi:Acetyltransferase (GNAT) family
MVVLLLLIVSFLPFLCTGLLNIYNYQTRALHYFKSTLRLGKKLRRLGYCGLRMENLDDLDEELLIKLSNDCEDHVSVCQLDKTFNASNGKSFVVSCVHSNKLNEADRNEIYTILEDNMKDYYEKTWGWKEVQKRDELFHPNSKFLCIHEECDVSNNVDAATAASTQQSTSTAPTAGSGSSDTSNNRRQLVGYAMFRFEWDDEDEPEHPVLYLYELQVHKGYRGLKIGTQVRIISNYTYGGVHTGLLCMNSTARNKLMRHVLCIFVYPLIYTLRLLKGCNRSLNTGVCGRSY